MAFLRLFDAHACLNMPKHAQTCQACPDMPQHAPTCYNMPRHVQTYPDMPYHAPDMLEPDVEHVVTRRYSSQRQLSLNLALSVQKGPIYLIFQISKTALRISQIFGTQLGDHKTRKMYWPLFRKKSVIFFISNFLAKIAVFEGFSNFSQKRL